MIDQMIHSFKYTVEFMERSITDLSGEEMLQQPPGVPNHAAWTVGHIIFSCQEMAEYLGGTPWLPDDWEAVFGYGSTPRPAEAPRYPQKAELQTLLADAAARLCDTLRETEDSVLKRQLSDEDFPSMAHVLLQVVVAHTAYHAGQLGMWRRAIGKEPAAVFI